jgi:hypothetical protein
MERAVAGPAIVALVIVLLAPAIEPQNLVHNGDFEATDEASPPPGWAMWGAQVYLGLPISIGLQSSCGPSGVPTRLLVRL